MQEKYQPKRMKAREQRLKPPAGYAWKHQEQRSFNRHVLKEKKSNLNKRYLKKQGGMIRSVQTNLYETKQLKTVKIRDELQKARVPHYRRKWNLLCPSCSASILKENHEFEDSDVEDSKAYTEEEFRSEVHNKKINEIISRNKHHRLSVHLRRRVHIGLRKANRKTNSPMGSNASKTESKTRTTEFMNKEQRLKMTQHDNKMTCVPVSGIGSGTEAKTAFDNYAVQKSSYDPQQDFRDSMLEMIIEKDIKQPKELEELLVYFAAAW
ncbi:hypothetical protein Leryth_017779 [Lithospermum erythrorhizon]|nr:hypothetical protein Leryth_017779 [Lithospermum erythrorhizon]